MSVWKNRNTWRWRIQRNGEERCGSARTRQEAIEAEARARAELASGLSGAPLRHTIAEAITKYLDSPDFLNLKSAEKQLSIVRKWESHLKGRHLAQAVDVADEAAAAWHRSGLKPATINRRLAFLRRVLNIAYRRWQWIDRPIADRITLLPGEESREVLLTHAEAVRLRRALPPGKARAWISLLVYTGLRAGELERLRADQISNGVIHLDPRTKTAKPRAVPVLQPGARYLRYVPLKGMGQQALRPYWYAARDAIGRPELRLHDLRHACASWLAQSGATMRDVQVWLGHTNPSTTARYAHLNTDRLREVASAADSRARADANARKLRARKTQAVD